MKREYTREEYLKIIKYIHNAGRNISITTDVIVGFPGETEEDFSQTLSLIDKVGYDSIFSFKYSPRPKTTAIEMGNPVEDEEKKRRLSVLQDQQREIQLQKNNKVVGKTYEVLVERSKKHNNELTGHTTSYQVVNFQGNSELLGKYVDVKITSAGPSSLVGDVV